MHTYAAPTCKILYNSDLSEETIIKQGESEVSVDLYDILEFIVHQAVDERTIRPLKEMIDDDTNNISGITIEMTDDDEGITRVEKLIIRGDTNGKATEE